MHYELTRDFEEESYKLNKGTKMYKKRNGLYEIVTNAWICDIGSPIYNNGVIEILDSISDKKIKYIKFNNGVELKNLYMISIGGSKNSVDNIQKIIIKFDEHILIESIQELTDIIGIGFSSLPYENNNESVKVTGFKLNDVVKIKFE